MDVDTVFELKTGDSRCILSALDFKPDHQLKYAVGTFDPLPSFISYEVQRLESFSFVRCLPCGTGVKNFEFARWAGVGQSSMEETAGDTAAVGEA